MTNRNKRTFCGTLTVIILVIILAVLLFAVSGYMIVEL